MRCLAVRSLLAPARVLALPRVRLLQAVRGTSGDRTLPDPVQIEQKMKEVGRVMREQKFLSPEVVDEECRRFWAVLKFPPLYFGTFTPEAIAGHIEAFAAAKRVATLSGGDDIDNLVHAVEVTTKAKGADAYALYFCAAPSGPRPGIPPAETPEARVERFISKYLENNKEMFAQPAGDDGLRRYSHGWAIQSYRSAAPAVEGGSTDVVMYVVTWSPFTSEVRAGEPHGTLDFVHGKKHHVRLRYAEALRRQAASGRLEVSCGASAEDALPMVLAAVDRDRPTYLQDISQALHKYENIKVMRKFVEVFDYGAREVHTMYFEVSGSREVFNTQTLTSITRELQHLELVPTGRHMSTSVIAVLRERGVLTDVKPTRVAYLHSAALFAYYFGALGPTLGAESALASAVSEHRPLLEDLYLDFRARIESPTSQPVGEALLGRIKSMVTLPDHMQVFNAFAVFNAAIVKSNFFMPRKKALAFRFDPSVIAKHLPPFGPADYRTELPYAVTLVTGAQFRAFHMRYRDISRGGIRVVRSRDEREHVNNKRNLLQECVRLAHTQLLKNKDIAEGGSKGVILIAPQYHGKVQAVFDRYVDAIMDISVPSSDVIDRLGKPEVLFFGPDEGTADLMDGAMLHAKARNYPTWRAFTTGKSPAYGGIPHDVYAMTTRSVRAYVEGIMAKLGLEQTACTKVQIGGPDGDLGSNEILHSSDRTLAIVDKDGVAFDPDGLCRAELGRLAHSRLTTSSFNPEALGKKGYRVLCGEKGARLPLGETVENGIEFRNTFHLRDDVSADFFVPCGGRPSSISDADVPSLLRDSRGRSRLKYKYIVEGANLFITESARMELERGGVVLFKDAATNKGGVTSSSLEVQAGLAMPNSMYESLMCEHKGSPAPEFRKKYVQHIIDRVRANARAEFELLWRLHSEGGAGGPTRTELVGKVSRKIVQLRDSLVASGVVGVKTAAFRAAIPRALPAPLFDVLKLEEIVERVPDHYLEAVVAAYLASTYVYTQGLQVDEVAFMKFISGL